jgi:cation diffusion facilitator family transporter
MTDPASTKENAAKLSMVASAFIVIGKMVVAIFTGSLGVFSETLHSLIDFGATVMTWFAVRWADAPADDDHHYGHAKIESVAALLEAVLLFLTAIFVGYEALRRLFSNAAPPHIEWWAFAILLLAIVIDLNRARVLAAVAKQTVSDALAADATHFQSDLYGSIAVLVGLAGVWLGLPWADSAAALVVSAIIAWIGWHLGRTTLETLLDRAPQGLSDKIREMVEHHEGVLAVEQLRLRQAGPVQFLTLTASVPRAKPISDIEKLKIQIIAEIKNLLPKADVSLIINPVAVDSETAVDKVNMIAAEQKLSIHHLTVQNIAGHLAVSFDVEVDGTMSLFHAHERATEFEDAVRNSLGDDVEVESHIEPQPLQMLEGSVAPKAMQARVENALLKYAAKEKSMKDVHSIRVRQSEGGLFVHYHCRFDPKLSVEAVHSSVDRVEADLQKSIRIIKRVIAHAEPLGGVRHKL